MKSESGSISARVFDAKFVNFSLRSRSRRSVVQDGKSAAAGDGLKQSCWANMPPELLRDVLVRIEASESAWPLRKNVVACAGVCRSWRKITMSIVKAAEVSGKLTFPLSLKQPGPRNSPLQCFIRRNGASHTYHLYLCLTEALTDPGKFLLSARRSRHPTYTDYVISLDANSFSRGIASYMGKLRSNFIGTKFTIYDSISGSCPVAYVAYEVNVMGPRGPRRMRCTVDQIGTPAGPAGSKSTKVMLQNKSPRWHEQLQCWCLNFRGRVTMASVKNFQLVASPARYDDDGGPSRPALEGDDDVVLQFGRVGRDLFTMDFRYPLSAFQAFAICLSSFDTKISCE